MNNEFKPFELAKRIENRILIGLAAITATIILVGWIAINENARMEEFTQRAEGRSIEAGARIFENNCSVCHGQDGRGLAGVAPALNNPVLFGYSFFADIDSEIALLNAQLSASADADERAELRTRIGTLEAERLALEETILYDWSDKIAELDEQLAALDEQALQLEGIDNASRLSFFIDQRRANEIAPLEQELADLQTKGTPPEPEQPAATAGEAPAEATTITEGETAAEAPAQEEPTPEEKVAAEYPLLTPEEVARYVELEAQITVIEEELKPYEALAEQRATLVAMRGRYQAVMDAQAEIEALRAQKAEIESQIAALGEPPAEGEEDPNAAEREALTQQAVDLTVQIDTASIARDDARQVLIDNGDILDFDPNAPGRLEEVGWAGSLQAFIESTVTGGRPTSSAYWPQPMAAWGQVAGGPLRGDQIRNITNFILNWEREFTIEDVRAVQQFARVPTFGAVATEGVPGTDNAIEIATTIEEQLASGEITEGDPTAGEALFKNTYGCGGCHGEQPAAGPPRVGMWTRASEDQDGRLSNTGNAGNPEGYMIQSIANPSAFVVPGFTDGIMPQNFTTERMPYQDLVNILAYLETQDQ